LAENPAEQVPRVLLNKLRERLLANGPLGLEIVTKTLNMKERRKRRAMLQGNSIIRFSNELVTTNQILLLSLR
jgi:hypothetical protein